MIYNQRQLRSFLAIIDQGSLNRAAQTMNMTQPTLSRLVADMERKLGQRLFERSAKGMIPTAAGELLTPYARLILDEIDSAHEALQALRGLQRGVARVGAIATLGRSILPMATARLLAQSAGLRVSLVEGPDDVLVDALLQRKIDIMITAEQPLIEGISVVRECPHDDAFAVFCAASHPLAQHQDVTLDDVLAQRWIMPATGATPRQLFDRKLAELGLSAPTITVEVASVDAMVSFVAKTDLLGWLPGALLNDAIGTGAIRRISVPDLELRRRFFIYRRDRGILPAPARELLKFIPAVGGQPAAAIEDEQRTSAAESVT